LREGFYFSMGESIVTYLSAVGIRLKTDDV